MLWFFVALQTMAPFIHAHAGAVQLNHAGFLHVHQGVHSDATWHVVAADEHGAGLPAPPTLHLALPDHTLPHALAPPLA